MNASGMFSITRRIWRTVTSVRIVLLLLLLATPGWGAEPPGTAPADELTLRQGEKMYRDGLLPSGDPMTAYINGDVTIPGNAFSCESCHLRSGIGSVEGQILSPPTNGLKLYRPYYQYPPQQNATYGRIKKGMWDGRDPVNPIHRPAYTDETLAAALRGGVDPNGRPFNSAMPRYQLDDRNMATLIAYLKNLSGEVSPGVDKNYTSIRFATVIAGDVPVGERKEMLAFLESVMSHHNRQGQIKNKYLQIGDENKAAPFNYPKFQLAVWQLSGPADTWRAQLDEYYRKEPVFALLGGLSAGNWQPVHEFSEQNRIPCLLPVTDLPVISDSDWYTLYFNKGVYQEGESTARYLALHSDPAGGTSVLQIIEDSPRARALAAGFLDAWKEQGRTAPESVSLKAGEVISATHIHRLNEQKHPAAIVLWTAAGTIPVLDSLAADKGAPMVFVSSSLLQKDLMTIPEKARGFTYISYPYRLEQGTDLFTNNARNWIKQRNIPDNGTRISTRLYSLTNVLLEPFKVVKRDFNPAGLGKGNVIMEEQFEMMMHVKRNYYRDYLFDVIGMFGDRPSIDFERLSFGPGQRYMSKGCYIVQLSPGSKPELLKKSDWVIY
jgi:hypothetical protein